jgi:hypothetical protein
VKVKGRCHCGQVHYAAEVDPGRVSICHCTDCQQLTGSAYRVTVRALRREFTLLAGEPKTYIKTADSGAQRAQVFCPNCGSPLYTYAVGNDETMGLRVGCIEQRQQLVPRRQIWCRSALGWATDIGGLPRSERE